MNFGKKFVKFEILTVKTKSITLRAINTSPKEEILTAFFFLFVVNNK